MSEAMELGERVVMVGEDGRPERVAEVTGITNRADGVAYEVRPLGSKRARFVATSELYRLRPA